MNDANIDIKQDSFDSLERRIYDLKNLISLGMSLASNLEFESLVESILFSCIGQIFIEKVAILLQVDIDVANYYIHMAKGYDFESDQYGIILHDKSPLLNFLTKNPFPHDFNTIADKPELSDELKKIDMLSPKLIVPMKSKDSLNGMIILGEKITGEDFADIERDFLNDLAKFAAIAVENSRLYQMATLDRMTRLYIHHYFQERLIEEVTRCKRNRTSLCLIMSDIDHFKKFNDTYGHQQGDSVLKETARIIKQNLRSIDIAARYGGEEFAVILPETEIKDAATIAERLRKKIEAHEFSGQDGPLNVTISMGVAQFNPEIDTDKDNFIKRTDRALYRAKGGGRNMVVTEFPGTKGD